MMQSREVIINGKALGKWNIRLGESDKSENRDPAARLAFAYLSAGLTNRMLGFKFGISEAQLYRFVNDVGLPHKASRTMVIDGSESSCLVKGLKVERRERFIDKEMREFLLRQEISVQPKRVRNLASELHISECEFYRRQKIVMEDWQRRVFVGLWDGDREMRVRNDQELAYLYRVTIKAVKNGRKQFEGEYGQVLDLEEKILTNPNLFKLGLGDLAKQQAVPLHIAERAQEQAGELYQVAMVDRLSTREARRPSLNIWLNSLYSRVREVADRASVLAKNGAGSIFERSMNRERGSASVQGIGSAAR